MVTYSRWKSYRVQTSHERIVYTRFFMGNFFFYLNFWSEYCSLYLQKNHNYSFHSWIQLFIMPSRQEFHKIPVSEQIQIFYNTKKIFMGTNDIYTKDYMSENNVFADAFNQHIYAGKQMIDVARHRKSIKHPLCHARKKHGLRFSSICHTNTKSIRLLSQEQIGKHLWC